MQVVVFCHLFKVKVIKMATSSTEISLKCSICLEFYFDPRVLPCLHTFCLHCLEPLVKDGTISCPQCRVKHKIPKGGVSH